MKSKGRVTMLALVAFVWLLAIAVVGCGGSSTATSVSMMGSGTTGSMMGGARVVLKNLAFNPASVTIAVGSTVTWENQDGTTHNVIADDGSFKSPDFGSGETFSFTFEKAGTYTYSCHIHPTMKGTVAVQ